MITKEKKVRKMRLFLAYIDKMRTMTIILASLIYLEFGIKNQDIFVVGGGGISNIESKVPFWMEQQQKNIDQSDQDRSRNLRIENDLKDRLQTHFDTLIKRQTSNLIASALINNNNEDQHNNNENEQNNDGYHRFNNNDMVDYITLNRDNETANEFNFDTIKPKTNHLMDYNRTGIGEKTFNTISQETMNVDREKTLSNMLENIMNDDSDVNGDGRIRIAIKSKRKFEFMPTHYDRIEHRNNGIEEKGIIENGKKMPRMIEIVSDTMPLRLHFRSQSAAIDVSQSHMSRKFRFFFYQSLHS